MGINLSNESGTVSPDASAGIPIDSFSINGLVNSAWVKMVHIPFMQMEICLLMYGSTINSRPTIKAFS